MSIILISVKEGEFDIPSEEAISPPPLQQQHQQQQQQNLKTVLHVLEGQEMGDNSNSRGRLEGQIGDILATAVAAADVPDTAVPTQDVASTDTPTSTNPSYLLVNQDEVESLRKACPQLNVITVAPGVMEDGQASPAAATTMTPVAAAPTANTATNTVETVSAVAAISAATDGELSIEIDEQFRLFRGVNDVKPKENTVKEEKKGSYLVGKIVLPEVCRREELKWRVDLTTVPMEDESKFPYGIQPTLLYMAGERNSSGSVVKTSDTTLSLLKIPWTDPDSPPPSVGVAAASPASSPSSSSTTPGAAPSPSPRGGRRRGRGGGGSSCRTPRGNKRRSSSVEGEWCPWRLVALGRGKTNFGRGIVGADKSAALEDNTILLCRERNVGAATESTVKRRKSSSAEVKTQSQALKINTIKASQKDGKGTKASKKPPSQRELESIGDDPNCTNVIKHRFKEVRGRTINQEELKSLENYFYASRKKTAGTSNDGEEAEDDGGISMHAYRIMVKLYLFITDPGTGEEEMFHYPACYSSPILNSNNPCSRSILLAGSVGQERFCSEVSGGELVLVLEKPVSDKYVVAELLDQTGKSANKTFKVSISGTFCRVFLDCFPPALRREVASVEEGTGGHVKCFVRLSRPKTGCASEMMVPIEIYKHKEMAPFCFCQTKILKEKKEEEQVDEPAEGGDAAGTDVGGGPCEDTGGSSGGSSPASLLGEEAPDLTDAICSNLPSKMPNLSEQDLQDGGLSKESPMLETPVNSDVEDLFETLEEESRQREIRGTKLEEVTESVRRVGEETETRLAPVEADGAPKGAAPQPNIDFQGVASYYPPTPPQSPNATPQGPSVDNVTSALDLGGGARRKAAISRRLASASHRERTRRIPNPPPPHDCIDASPPTQSWLARAWRILGSAVMNLLFLFAVIYVVVAYFFR